MFELHYKYYAEKEEDEESLIKLCRNILRHIYTGRAPRVCVESITEPLFMAADMYQLDQLKEDCEEGFIQQLKLDNVFKYLALAQCHNDTVIRCYDWKKLLYISSPNMEETSVICRIARN